MHPLAVVLLLFGAAAGAHAVAGDLVDEPGRSTDLLKTGRYMSMSLSPPIARSDVNPPDESRLPQQAGSVTPLGAPMLAYAMGRRCDSGRSLRPPSTVRPSIHATGSQSMTE